MDKSSGSASFGIESETEGSNGWKKALTVKVTVADNESGISSAKYCIATGETCAPSQNANLSNGIFNVPLENNASAQKVCVTVTNGAGKESEVLCDNNTYQVDGEGPTIKNPSAATSWGQTNGLDAKAEDPISGIGAYAFDKSNTTTKDTSWTTNTNYPKTEQSYSGVADSNGDWYIHVRDQAGNISSTKITVSKVDTSAATASYAIGSETAGLNSWKQKLTIRVTATDNESSVSSAKYCVTTSSTCDPNQNASLSNGTTSKTFDVTFPNNASAQRVCVKITNGAGKESGVLCDNVTYLVDGAGPTINNPSAATSWGQTNSIGAKAVDTISGIGAYAFDKSNTTTKDTSWTTNTNYPKTEQSYSGSANSNGDWYIHVRDQAGNISSTKITVSKVDTSAATASYAIGSQTAGLNNWKQKLTIRVTATDNESGVSSAKYCTTTSSTCDPTSTASLSTGTNSKTFDVPFPNNASAQRVCVKITNGAGKESGTLCDTTTYSVDGEGPTIKSPSAATSWGQTNSIGAKAVDTIKR